jgi:hypothetical protein
MLNFPPYYFRTIRYINAAFASLFNNMVMVKYDNVTNQEISRLTVPIQRAGKENFLNRLLENPRGAKPIEISLPRASFEVVSYQYDPSRKLSTFNSVTVPGVGSSAQQQYQSVPWNIGMELYIYVRNRADGEQLIEQILPVFSPDYTLTINYVPELGISRNTPILLDSVTCQDDYEGDAQEKERTIIWTLGFTIQAQFFGPIITGNVITQVNTNFYIDSSLGGAGMPAEETLTMNTAAGIGTYQLNEIVYQGANLPDSSGTGNVSSWNANAGILVVTNVQGTFVAGENVTGVNTGATYPVAQTTPNIIIATVTNTPDPANANSSTTYTVNTAITEFPKTV